MRYGSSMLAGVALCLFLSVVDAASAAPVAGPTASQVTSPGDPTHVFFDSSSGSANPPLTVSGTTTGPGNVDLRCYEPGFTNDASGRHIADNVPVTDSSFSASVDPAKFTFLFECVLRAVPVGDGAAHDPGSADPYQGPRIAITRKFASRPVNDARRDLLAASTDPIVRFFYENSGVSGHLNIGGPSSCPLSNAFLLSPETLAPSGSVFDCNGNLSTAASGSPPRSGLRVDGADVVPSSKADYNKPGYQGVSLSESFDPATGALTVRDFEPILKCVSDSEFSCASYASTGVELDRIWVTSNEAHTAYQSDRWRSTDGAQHSLDLLYGQQFTSREPGATFRFPGSGAFSRYNVDDQVTVARGPASIYVKPKGDAPDEGDAKNPHGVVSYASAPDGAVSFARELRTGKSRRPTEGFLMPYQRTIPADGSITLRFAYNQEFALSDAQAGGNAAEAAFSPTVTITAPADGSSTTNPDVVATGTAGDGVGLSSFKVNGQDVAVAGDGKWSKPLTLAPGVNTIRAVAVNQDGITAQQQITVNYAAPGQRIVAPGPGGPRRSSFRLDSAYLQGNDVIVPVVCDPGPDCNGTLRLQTREHILDDVFFARNGRRNVLGKVKFNVKGGRTKKVKIHLQKNARGVIARKAGLPQLLVFGTLNEPVGPNASAFTHLKLKRNKHLHHRKH